MKKTVKASAAALLAGMMIMTACSTEEPTLTSAEPEVAAETTAGAETEKETEAQTETESETEPQTETTAETQTEAGSETEPQTETTTETQPETEIEAQISDIIKNGISAEAALLKDFDVSAAVTDADGKEISFDDSYLQFLEEQIDSVELDAEFCVEIVMNNTSDGADSPGSEMFLYIASDGYKTALSSTMHGTTVRVLAEDDEARIYDQSTMISVDASIEDVGINIEEIKTMIKVTKYLFDADEKITAYDIKIGGQDYILETYGDESSGALYNKEGELRCVCSDGKVTVFILTSDIPDGIFDPPEGDYNYFPGKSSLR